MSEEIGKIEDQEENTFEEKETFTEQDMEVMYEEICKGWKKFNREINSKAARLSKGEKITKDEWENHKEFRKLLEEKERFYKKILQIKKARGDIKSKNGEQGKMVDMSVVKGMKSTIGDIVTTLSKESNG